MKSNRDYIEMILLAEDDEDDREFFSDALKEVCGDMELVKVENGLKLMNLLNAEPLSQRGLIFLDLNMPLKNGFECLGEIRQSKTLKHFPVIIFSTSIQPETVSTVYKQGANLYIVKPNTFAQLKKILQQVLSIKWNDIVVQPAPEKFVLQS